MAAKTAAKTSPTAASRPRGATRSTPPQPADTAPRVLATGTPTTLGSPLPAPLAAPATPADLTAIRAELDHQARLATLGTIAGLIAHEFNNLLTPVISYAQMALAEPQDRALATKALERTLAGAEQAAQIATALLELARPDQPQATIIAEGTSGTAGTGGLGVARARLRDAIDRTLAGLARDPARDGIHLHVTLADDGLSAAIRPVALQHVLLNLVLNARKAMLPGGGRLTIIARQHVGGAPGAQPGELDSRACSTWNGHDSPTSTCQPAEPGATVAVPPHATLCPNAWVELSVEDAGRGMTAQRLGTLFQPFSAARAADDAATNQAAERSDLPRGNGLGLIVCKRLVEQAGGWIMVSSSPGVGTRMRVVLPAA